MAKKDTLAVLKDLEKLFNEKRNKVQDDRYYMKKHGFNMEDAALEYKEQAYRDAWLIVFHKINELENIKNG